MKKSILFLVVALVVISISMSSYSKPEVHDETCEDMFTLSTELIEAMKLKYESTQYESIKKDLEFMDGKGDAKAIWFSLDVLREFICQIETHSDAESADLGIRIYYAAYPKKGEWYKYPKLKVPDSYAERHTLVLLPTETQSDGSIQDLNLTQSPVMSLVLTGTDIDDKKKPGKNHGSLFPPGELITGHH